MARAIPSALQTKIVGGGCPMAHLVQVTPSHGAIVAITDWNRAINVNLDGSTAYDFLPNDISELAQITSQINAPIDDSELHIQIYDKFTADAIRRGFYQNADVIIGIIDPTDLANPWKHSRYRVGKTKVEGVNGVFELLGIEKSLENPVGRSLSANCRNEFGDSTCKLNINVTVWQASHAYALGAERKPTAGGKLWFRVTTAGTSGASEPTWAAGTVNDGTVVWTSFNARRVTGTVTSVIDTRQFAASGINIADDYFGNGYIEWLTGSNAGERHRVYSDDGAGNIVQRSVCWDIPLVGDAFSAIVGCRKTITICRDKHNNVINNFSFPYLAPEFVSGSAPKDDA
jgi:hypothetical protein